MAENKPQQNKLENMVRLSNLIKEGAVTKLVSSLRETEKDFKDVWGMVRRIEEQQEERVRKENLEYEQNKAQEDSESAQQEAPAKEAAETAANDSQEVSASPLTPSELSVDAEPVVEVKNETPKEPVSAIQNDGVKQPSAPSAVNPAPAVVNRTGTATARPSFLSPNQRPRPTYTPPTSRPVLDRSGERRPMSDRPMGARPPYSTSRPPMGARPPMNGTRPPLRKGSGFASAAPDFTAAKPQRHEPAKKEFVKTDDKKTMSKRTLIRKGFVDDGFSVGEDRMGSRKLKLKKKQSGAQQINKVTHAVITTENLTVKMLSEQMGVTANMILKKLMEIGQMVNINSVVNFEDMALVADDFGVTLELKLETTNEEKLLQSHETTDENPENMESRPPIVTVMGHVDHGKTSLLDAIRKTSVVTGEAGGITQHIGAYTVTLNGRRITFIDTPGHEAFTAMRARGAQVTDVAVIVVAADDGIMPQTVEAINHAKAANVPIVIAVNKIDKPTANIDRVKQELTTHGIVCEEWGGDSPLVGVSAKTGQNLDQLLENILLVADIKELKANPNAMAKGTVIEARLDKGKGPVASIIVQNGTLHVGDTVVSGMTYGHIRAMTDDKGRLVKEAGPSTAVSVLGFQEVPEAGGLMYVVEDEKLAKHVIAERDNKIKNKAMNAPAVSLDDVFAKINDGELKSLNLIVKADVQGSVEALKASLVKLSNEEVKVNVIHCAVGAITRSDVMLAETAKAVVIGFNVRADAETKIIAEHSGIDIRLYRIIYECLEDVEAAIKGMLAPKFREQVLGHAEVRNVFNITGSGVVAGCYVTDGKIVRNAKLRVLRDNIVVGEGNVDSLKRFKDDAKEVATGYECGLSIENYTDFKEKDIIEAFSLEQILS